MRHLLIISEKGRPRGTRGQKSNASCKEIASACALACHSWADFLDSPSTQYTSDVTWHGGPNACTARGRPTLSHSTGILGSMDRRQWVMAMGAAGVAARGVYGWAPESGRFRTAVCAYSFRKGLQDKSFTYTDLIRMAAELGLDGIDLTTYWLPDTSDQTLFGLKRLAYRSGVALYSIGIRAHMAQPTPELQAAEVEMVRKWLDVAERLGASHMRIRRRGSQGCDRGPGGGMGGGDTQARSRGGRQAGNHARRGGRRRNHDQCRPHGGDREEGRLAMGRGQPRYRQFPGRCIPSDRDVRALRDQRAFQIRGTHGEEG